MSLFLKAAPAQGMEIPATIQISILLKTLSFDRKLSERSGDELNMLIIYQGNYTTSQLANKEVSEALNKLSINKVEGIPIKYYFLNIDESNLLSAVIKYEINLIYVCPLRGISLKTITSISREKSIISFTGIPSYVESGISIGVGLKRDKPQIVINLTSSKAEGADFSSQLLKLSKVIY
ncbi:MAG: YfiR family protein [Bacteroidetes bacterium]|nr:YfiR family protein [Bacteroidota bacterium]